MTTHETDAKIKTIRERDPILADVLQELHRKIKLLQEEVYHLIRPVLNSKLKGK